MTERDRHTQPLFVKISQVNTELRIDMFGTRYFGLAVDDGVHVTTGAMAFSLCGGSPRAQESGDARVTIKPSSATMTGRFTTFFNTSHDGVDVCTLKLKRIATSDPGIGACQ